MPRFKHGTARNQFRAAMTRSAETRQCPKCGRKSAIKRLPADDFYESVRYCRWDDCDYIVHGSGGSFQDTSPASEPEAS